jgi:uncharacterized protein
VRKQKPHQLNYESTSQPKNRGTLQVLDSGLVRSFVIAGHGNLAKVKELLGLHPDLLNQAYSWSETDEETAIMAAGQVGNVSIAEFLLSKGAPLSICTAAMLGRQTDVERILAHAPEETYARGAHGIPLLPHAALSGNLDLVRVLVEHGALEGSSFALHNAVSRGYKEVAEWLLDNTKLDVNWKDYQGKTPLAVAIERKDAALTGLLRSRGGTS